MTSSISSISSSFVPLTQEESIKAPSVSKELVETASKVERMKSAQSTRETSSVPPLPVTPPDSQTQVDAMAALIAMMAVILLIESKMTQNMAKNSESQNSMSIDYTQAMKIRGDDQVKKIEQAEEDARKAGIFQKIAMAFQYVAAILTAPIDPVGSAMMMAGATLQLLQTEGVIPQQWINSPIGDFFAKMGVTVLLSAGTAAAGNAMSNAAEAGEEVGAQAASSVSHFNWGVCAMLVGTLNPTSDVAKAVGGSDKTQEILSIVSAVVTAIACAYMGYKATQDMGQNPLSNLLKQRFNATQLETLSQRLIYAAGGLNLTDTAMGTTAAGFTIQQAKDVQAQAAPQRDYTLLQSTVKVAQAQAQSYTKWEQQQMAYFDQVNSAFMQITDSSAVAADVLLQG